MLKGIAIESQFLHTLKLNSEWSSDGTTPQEGGGTLVLAIPVLVPILVVVAFVVMLIFGSILCLGSTAQLVRARSLTRRSRSQPNSSGVVTKSADHLENPNPAGMFHLQESVLTLASYFC